MYFVGYSNKLVLKYKTNAPSLNTLNYISFLLFTWQYFLSLLIYLEYLYLSFNYVILCCIFITIIFPQYKISLPFTLDICFLFKYDFFLFYIFLLTSRIMKRNWHQYIFKRKFKSEKCFYDLIYICYGWQYISTLSYKIDKVFKCFSRVWIKLIIIIKSYIIDSWMPILG